MAEFETWVTVVFAILGIGAVIGGPLLFYLFYHFRNHHPITGRPLIPYILTSLSMWLYIMAQCLKTLFDDKVPCILYYILVEPNQFVVLAPLILIRLWLTYYAFKVTQEKYNPDSDQWYIKHHYLVTTRFMLPVAAVYFAVFMIPPIVLITEDLINCEDPLRTRLYSYPLSMVPVNLLMFMTWKYQVLKDGYWIKTELKLLAYQVALWMPVQMSLVFVYWSDNEQYLVSDRLSSTLGGIWFNITSLVFPLIMVYHSGRTVANLKSKINSSSSSVTYLQDILDDNGMREAFLQHLMKEFNVENLIYIDSLEQTAAFFEHTKNDLLKCDESRSASAASENVIATRNANVKFVELYVKFFIDDSPLQVNISWDSKNIVETEVKKICGGELPKTIDNLSDIVDNTRLGDCGTFDGSRAEIFRLLEDVYPRFVTASSLLEAPPIVPTYATKTSAAGLMELTEV